MAAADCSNDELVPQADRRRALLARHPWVAFVLPLLVYMLAQMLEPSPPDAVTPAANTAADATVDPEVAAARRAMERESGSRRILGFTVLYEHYPLVYTGKILLTIAVLAFVWPAYAQFPCRTSWLAVGVGVAGIFVWVGLCEANLERRFLELFGTEDWLSMGERPGYNPLEQLKNTPMWAYVFLAIRFTGLVLVVPLIEEMFYRGFFMRLMISERWWEASFSQLSTAAILVGIFVPALAHPGELLAAVAWFGMVTWLLVQTRNIWDCVVAHAVTNLLLGLYVLACGEWQLW